MEMEIRCGESDRPLRAGSPRKFLQIGYPTLSIAPASKSQTAARARRGAGKHFRGYCRGARAGARRGRRAGGGPRRSGRRHAGGEAKIRGGKARCVIGLPSQERNGSSPWLQCRNSSPGEANRRFQGVRPRRPNACICVGFWAARTRPSHWHARHFGGFSPATDIRCIRSAPSIRETLRLLHQDQPGRRSPQHTARRIGKCLRATRLRARRREAQQPQQLRTREHGSAALPPPSGEQAGHRGGGTRAHAGEGARGWTAEAVG